MPYAAAAISEPWACVEASYHLNYRSDVLKGGDLLVLGPNDTDDHDWKDYLKEHLPSKITVSEVSDVLEKELADFAKENEISFEKKNAEELKEEKFDDVILLKGNNEKITFATKLLKKKAIIAVIGEAERADLDVGALHYDDIQYTGTKSHHWADAYGYSVRSELKRNGIALMQGSGGPMGLMHIQRALELDEGPRLIVATDHHDDRLEHVQDFLSPIAKKKGKTLITVNEYHKEDYERVMDMVKTAGGFDDIVTMIANPKGVAEAFEYIAPAGVMNIFSGMKNGTLGNFDVSKLQGERRCTILGHSGSGLDDQRMIIDKFARHELNTWKSVAAIGGMNQVPDGLEAMMKAKYSGKIIIYPQVEDFPLSSLGELKERLPEVYALLSEGGTWNQEAERKFLSLMEEK